jgi:hypothetical protein
MFDIIEDDDASHSDADPAERADPLDFRALFYFIIPRDDYTLKRFEEYLKTSRTPIVESSLNQFKDVRWRHINLKWQPVAPEDMLWHASLDPKLRPVLEEQLLELLNQYGGNIVFLRLFLYIDLHEGSLPPTFADSIFNQFVENIRGFLEEESYVVPPYSDASRIGFVYLDSAQIEPFDVELHFNPQRFNMDYNAFVKAVGNILNDEGAQFLCEVNTSINSFCVSYLHPCQAMDLIKNLGDAEIVLFTSGRAINIEELGKICSVAGEYAPISIDIYQSAPTTIADARPKLPIIVERW